ncbi:MAG: hypothetical protein WC655_11690 [Candidatus Hydrogenedentales bacterium]|jgi:hypothetical protein
MKRNAGIALILLGVLGVVAWQFWPGSKQPAPVTQPPVVEEPAPQPPPAAPVPEPEPPQAEVAAPQETPPPVIEEAAKPDPFGGKPITVETLTGCKEIQQIKEASITIEYARNGEWKVNGNVRAKWTIEGDKVKIYKDGTDEVHYIDIVNNKLVYNGKEIAMTR